MKSFWLIKKGQEKRDKGTWTKWAKYRTVVKWRTQKTINYTKYKWINIPSNEGWSH